MKQREAMKLVEDYLRRHHLRFSYGINEGCIRILIDFRAVPHAPGYRVEGSIWLYKEESLEARFYYTVLGSEICRKSEHISELLQVLNFCNARVWLACCDGGSRLFKPHLLYTPRIYLTADDAYDITITTIIPYDFLELAPIETLVYMTAFCPELLDRLAIPIFRVLLGRESAEEAIEYIKRELLEE